LNQTQPLNSPVFDWDDELTFEFLCQRYNFPFTAEILLPSFPTINFPRFFIDFARVPYPMFDQDKPKQISILDGTCIDQDQTIEFIQNKYANCSFPIPFICICGEDITDIFLISKLK
jgi:hypothetical protein